MSDGRGLFRPQRAGAFGFSPAEARGLVAFGATVLVVLGIQSWSWRPVSSHAPAAVAEIQSVVSQEESADSNRGAVSSLDSLAVEYDHRTDVNSASRWELMRLPGIGDVLADRIIASREKDGPFRSLHDLERVFGIGPKKIAMLGGWVRFGEMGVAASSVGETE